MSDRNGLKSLKYIVPGGSVFLAIIGLMFNLTLKSQAALDDFSEKYDERLRQVEMNNVRFDEKIDAIITSLERIEGRLDR